MSQLPDQLLKSSTMPIMGPLTPNINLINQVAMPQIIPNQSNLPLANNFKNIDQIKLPIQKQQNNNQEKRHRRSKHIQEGRNFACECGKAFLSQPALNNHKKTKHPDLFKDMPQRGRGRPRKYPPKNAGDFESTKYDIFFTMNQRGPEEGKSIDINSVIQNVFSFIYQSQNSDKLFSKPKTYKENPILNNLANETPISTKPKNEKTCDEVFYEYLYTFKNKCNQKFLSLLIKFILLFRECYDISKTKELKEEDKKAVTCTLTPEGLPDLCNEFYGDFMEPNNFFGIYDSEEKNEIIEIIQHFCIWLFKNEYTKSKLSLAS